MAELNDEEVDRKRLQIWKWYVLDWQEENIDKDGEILRAEITWEDYVDRTKNDVLDIEAFLHGDYLNLGNTLMLIEKYMKDSSHRDMFRKFAIEDIMEMTSEDTKDKSISEAENRVQAEEVKKHTYQFTVSVEATDKEHARQALLFYLAGDERIKVQK
jgi:ribosomal protein L20A (L18A)